MNSKYINYNDYHLLYLINEGSQVAYDILLFKYDKLIYKIATQYYPYGDKLMDLVQEGRMVLVKCIEKYRDDGGASFYSYFKISLVRRIHTLIKDDNYYHFYIVAENDDSVYTNDIGGVNIHKGYHYFKDDMEIKMFDECIIDDVSIKEFSIKYNMKYSKAYTLYKDIISRLKRTFSID